MAMRIVLVSMAALLRVLAFAEGAVGDALQEAGVMLKGAHMAPVDLVGVGVEMLVAEALPSGRASRRSRLSCR